MEYFTKKKDDDIFLELLIKEYEYDYCKKQYNKSTYFGYIRKFINKLYSLYKSRILPIKLHMKASTYHNCIDSNNMFFPPKILFHNSYTHLNYKVHYMLKEKHKNIVLKKGKNILLYEYSVYLIFEYLPDGMVTRHKYFLKTFNNRNKAISYFKRLRKKYKLVNPKFIISYLIKLMDSKCEKMIDHIKK